MRRRHMKIAMIGHKRVPSREGGVEVVVTELAERLARRGHQVDCYNRWEPSVQKDMPKRSEYKGVNLLRVRTFRHSALNAAVYSLFAVLRAVFKGYDVIHIHAEGPAAMSGVTRLFRVPTVVTIHGLDWQRAKWGGFATRYIMLGEKTAAKRADEVIVLSKDCEDYFEKTYSRHCRLINNGITVKPPVEPDEIKSRWGLEKNGYILFLARIVPEKGLHHLIAAYREIKTDKPLVIAGNIEQKTGYVSLVVNMASEDSRIITTGFVTGRTFEELMSAADIYVLPSDIEGMPISLLEALSYGRRCLVSDIAENRETAGEHARYFQKGDSQSLRAELEKMLREKPDEKAAEARVEYVRENFNWDAVTDATIEVYKSAIDRRSGIDKSGTVERSERA
ncbi:MAG: glycosyltransferase family 4 protein [Clostridia bacterium]|nr:glycosyltransferase family 4 protein [Clostridia bacterium]